jgi:hypothetical protein
MLFKTYRVVEMALRTAGTLRYIKLNCNVLVLMCTNVLMTTILETKQRSNYILHITESYTFLATTK